MGASRQCSRDRPPLTLDSEDRGHHSARMVYCANLFRENIYYVATLCNLVKCDLACKFENEISHGNNVIIENVDNKLRRFSVRTIPK
ncbi:hypothetical protein EDWATA_02114 [Edwardsiella tarda ATCC 23685]|uniref:Uncharacterized protein n=1 Tax=Edwardsiella tarda ATCC 23685 TaxID=500638 RepID=D4F5T6_EDWTA|nr:hypothetical protein EDWATA_02114 [Edwardsiella tarda ATCC 23685]